MLRALARPLRPSQLLCAFRITQQLHSFNRRFPAVKAAVVGLAAISCRQVTILLLALSPGRCCLKPCCSGHAIACACRRLLSGGPGVMFIAIVVLPPSELLAVKHQPFERDSNFARACLDKMHSM